MSHKHKCECSHDSVKYCKTCHVVHCQDCNQEWGAKPPSYWTYSPYYNANVELLKGTAAAAPLTKSGEVLCKHEG